MRTVTRAGVTWNVSEPDTVAGWWDEWEKGWEQETLDVIDRFASKDAFLLDIGAWIGPITLWAARLGPVVAIEPDPVAVEYLAKNLADNAVDAKVYVGAVTLDGHETTVYPGRFGWGSSMTRVGTGGQQAIVKGFTVESIIRAEKLGCSLVKMDIEGGEITLLPTVAPWLAKRGIPILVSMHEPHWGRQLEDSWRRHYEHYEVIRPTGDPHWSYGWSEVLAW